MTKNKKGAGMTKGGEGVFLKKGTKTCCFLICFVFKMESSLF